MIILYLFAISNLGTVLSCHSFSAQPNQQYPLSSRARARGVTSMDRFDRNAIDLDYSSDLKCDTHAPYTSNDMRSIASIYPVSEQPQLSVFDGGKVTCAFDDPMEYCSWHNVQDTLIKFWKARFDQSFDMERFDCTNVRRFALDKYFLLAGGEPALMPQTVAIETEIPCQYGDAMIQFDFWANTQNPILRFCITKNSGADISCEDILPMPNPVHFLVPMTSEPIKVRIEIVNLSATDIILIDSIYYNGQICEMIDESSIINSDLTTASSVELLSPTAGSRPLLITGSTAVLQDKETGIEKFFDEDEGGIIEDSKSSTKMSVFGIKNDDLQRTMLSTSTSAPPLQFSELSPCSALTCTFNDGDSCFYGLQGVGSTAPWILSDQLTGNRHTGVQRVNVGDQKQVGFVFVGNDSRSDLDEIFVMESPKFNLTVDTFLVFDVYLRSILPRLKVCVDNFDDCPYSSPTLDKKQFWHLSHKVPLKEGARKVFFVAQQVGNHQFLAVDNIRLENSDGSSFCEL